MSPRRPRPSCPSAPDLGDVLGRGWPQWTPAQAPVVLGATGCGPRGDRDPPPKRGSPGGARSCLVSAAQVRYKGAPATGPLGVAAPASRLGSTGCQGWEGIGDHTARSPRFVGRKLRPRGLGEASGEKGFQGPFLRLPPACGSQARQSQGASVSGCSLQWGPVLFRGLRGLGGPEARDPALPLSWKIPDHFPKAEEVRASRPGGQRGEFWVMVTAGRGRRP